MIALQSLFPSASPGRCATGPEDSQRVRQIKKIATLFERESMLKGNVEKRNAHHLGPASSAHDTGSKYARLSVRCVCPTLCSFSSLRLSLVLKLRSLKPDPGLRLPLLILVLSTHTVLRLAALTSGFHIHLRVGFESGPQGQLLPATSVVLSSARRTNRVLDWPYRDTRLLRERLGHEVVRQTRRQRILKTSENSDNNSETQGTSPPV
jgi:hypothetical protein